MSEVQSPLTAALGEPGRRNSQGFSNVTTAHLTRPITVSGADGKIVYDKQTTDSPKAADGHIRLAGYRRVGPWENGHASVERIPLGAKLKTPAIILAVLALAITGISMSFAHAAAVAPEAAQKACHDAVTSKLPAAATPDFQSTDLLDNDEFGFGGRHYGVSGNLRSLAIDGMTHDMTYQCDAYVDSSGTVHKVTAGMTWK